MKNAFEVPSKSIFSPTKTAKTNKPRGWSLAERRLNTYGSKTGVKVRDAADCAVSSNALSKEFTKIAEAAFREKYPERIDD